MNNFYLKAPVWYKHMVDKEKARYIYLAYDQCWAVNGIKGELELKAIWDP